MWILHQLLLPPSAQYLLKTNLDVLLCNQVYAAAQSSSALTIHNNQPCIELATIFRAGVQAPDIYKASLDTSKVTTTVLSSLNTDM